MRRSFLLAGLAASSIIAACGARSPLADAELTAATSPSNGGSGSGGTPGVSGSGGATTSSSSTTTSGTAGSGGVGGAPAGCPALSLVSPIVEVTVGSADFGERPRLTAASDDGQEITVAYQVASAGAPGPFLAMRHATFSPWLAWPASGMLGPSFDTYASPQLDPAFAIAGAPGGKLGMLVSHASSFASMSPRVDPHASGGGPTVSVLGLRALFAARNGDLQIVGTLSPQRELIATLIREEAGTFVTQPYFLSCAFDLTARAVPYEDGFLIVSTNGAGNTQGICNGLGLEPPTKIDVFRVGSGQPPSFVASITPGVVVEELDAAPHPDGVWIVWPVIFDALPTVLRYALYAPALGGVVSTGDITTMSEGPSGFAAAALGRSLAVAYKDDPAGNPPDLAVRVIDESGAAQAHAVIPNPPAFVRASSLIGSPAGDSLVVAMEQTGFPARPRLARLDCVAGP